MTQQRFLLNNVPIYTLGFLVVGIFMGGIYSLPAMKITGSKEPWFTIFISLGLTVTVAGIGLIIFKSNLQIIYAILAANLLLIIRRCFGKLDHNVERFGIIHAISLAGCFWYVFFIERTAS